MRRGEVRGIGILIGVAVIAVALVDAFVRLTIDGRFLLGIGVGAGVLWFAHLMADEGAQR